MVLTVTCPTTDLSSLIRKQRRNVVGCGLVAVPTRPLPVIRPPVDIELTRLLRVVHATPEEVCLRVVNTTPEEVCYHRPEGVAPVPVEGARQG